MAIVHTGSGIEMLGRLFSTGTATASTEAELLERFVSHGDPCAFEALLERHGPMVLRVCRRVLTDPNDVDDAFQATFLILVKRAASIRERKVLGTWLFGVARRVAVRARVNARRRNSRERSGLEPISAENRAEKSAESRELRTLIDDELERLPYKYREPMVLCELEGQTHEQAAAQLRCPVGTVKSRLSRGRERLRARLIRRGVAPAGALALLLTDETASAVPVALIKPTVRFATQLVAGRVLPVSLACLIRGVTHSMIISQLKNAAVVALAVTVTLGGVLMIAKPSPARLTLVLETRRRDFQEKAAAALPVEKPNKPAETGSERFVLENGLTVILRPIKGTNSIALVVLYTLGGDHDPPHKSGLTHLLEHVYVTAAAGQAKARTAEEFAARYPAGANGQTGDRYTVFATVFPKNDLEAELKDAAARMGDLHVNDDDLPGERIRLLVETGNMFRYVPALAAVNEARELIRPTPLAGRRGGQFQYFRTSTAQELQAWWIRYYKPRNAILTLSGAIDPGAARESIKAYFGPLPSGEQAPAPGEPGPARLGSIFRDVKVPRDQSATNLTYRAGNIVREVQVGSPLPPNAQSIACIAYKAREPGSEFYAPFLVMVARLWADAGKLGDAGPTGSAVYFTPLDDGAIVALSTALKAGETRTQAFVRIEAFVAETIAPRLRPLELMTARQKIGPLLGLVDLPDNFLANNPYGVAFSLARREQLGMSSASLRQAWAAVTDDQLRHVAREVFGPDRHAGAFIAVEK